jgi:hypothetical protein
LSFNITHISTNDNCKSNEKLSNEVNEVVFNNSRGTERNIRSGIYKSNTFLNIEVEINQYEIFTIYNLIKTTERLWINYNGVFVDIGYNSSLILNNSLVESSNYRGYYKMV